MAVAARLAQARALAASGRVAEAVAIWRELAEAGDARAQTNLGACYATGAGLAADAGLARHWLERGAAAGDVLGQRNLAILLSREAPSEAADWYRRAAAQGDAVSQDQLSRLLLDGAEAGWPEARRLAEAAALQGHSEAAARLAVMCHAAKGGPRDPAAAARWWQAAAAAGHADSAAMLGAALHMGQGVAADQLLAMAWLLVAAARHSTLVRPFLPRVEALLTEAQQAEARSMAARMAQGA